MHWLAVPKKFREVVEIWTCCAELFFVKFTLIYRWRLFRILENVIKLSGEEMTETFFCLQYFQSRKLDRDILFFLKKWKWFSARFWISWKVTNIWLLLVISKPINLIILSKLRYLGNSPSIWSFALCQCDDRFV